MILKSEIKKAAKESTFAAIRASRKKWFLFKALPWSKLEELFNEDLLGLNYSWCALCHRFLGSRKPCPLSGKRCRHGGCVSLYQFVANEYFNGVSDSSIGEYEGKEKTSRFYDRLLTLEIQELKRMKKKALKKGK
jgi:hypothetical protein